MKVKDLRPEGKAGENQGRNRTALTKEGDAQRTGNETLPLDEGFSQTLVRKEHIVEVVVAVCYL